MTLSLVRMNVDLRALATFAVARGLSDDDGGYALHCALRARFGAAGPQPFRFLPDHRRGPHLLGYAADGGALADAAALPVADAQLHAVFAGPPDILAMPERWRDGARYAFEVRVRPVVRYGRTRRAARAERADAWQKRAGELDAFVAACERAGEGVFVDRAQVYTAWLERQLAAAATLEAAELRLLRRTSARRATHPRSGAGAAPERSENGGAAAPGRRRTARVDGPDAVMAGTLVVRDPDAFARALARGVGRHAAFGFGMLLLSPPGRPGPGGA